MKKAVSFLLIGVIVAGFYSTGWSQSRTASGSAITDKNVIELKKLLELVGERIQKYHDTMFNIAFTEVLRQQELNSDGTSKNKPKEFVYESIVINSRAPANQQNSFPVITRTLKFVDGKPAEQKKLRRRSKCVETNPQTEYADPLAFLLPKYQSNFIFSYGGEADLENRKMAIILIDEPPASEPVRIVEKGGCFQLSRNLRSQGKIWIDPKTFDVFQLQWRLVESFKGKTSSGAATLGIFPIPGAATEVSYENEETTIRFRQVTFQNPQQVLLLPFSSETSWILKGARIAGFRETTEYTRYRRYLTSVEIKDSDENPQD